MIDWLLKGEPREAQLEALRRSYRGIATRDAVDGPVFHRPIEGHTGDPAKGWGHFLEQRVGKTPTDLNEFMLLRRDFGFKWHIVLVPNAFKDDWPLEAEKFGIDCAAMAMESSKRHLTQKFIDKNKANGGLIAVNYEALRYKDNLAILGQVTGPLTMIGADESISIKNHDSGDTKAAIALAKECKVRRAMSGKPISQGPHDLWAQLRFIAQIEGWNPFAFKNAFCQMGGFQGKQILGSKNEDRLHKIQDVCSWNARKVDWLKTPGKDYAPERMVALLPDQLVIYKRMQEEFLCEVADGTIIAADQIITKLIKMQQIASGFIIDEDGKIHDLMPVDKNPKILEVRKMLSEEIRLDAGGKVIIVCHFRRSMELLEEALGQYRPALIRGKDWHRSNDRDIISEKKRFNEDPNCHIMIGQEQALRYGHTLMGSEDHPCHNEIYYENNYSLNDRSQTEERAQGAGQTAPITIWDFIATEKDRETIQALQRKEDVASVVLRYARGTGVLPHR